MKIKTEVLLNYIIGIILIPLMILGSIIIIPVQLGDMIDDYRHGKRFLENEEHFIKKVSVIYNLIAIISFIVFLLCLISVIARHCYYTEFIPQISSWKLILIGFVAIAISFLKREFTGENQDIRDEKIFGKKKY